MYDILEKIGLLELNKLYRPAIRHKVHKGSKYKLKFMQELYGTFLCNEANNIKNEKFSNEVQVILR